MTVKFKTTVRLPNSTRQEMMEVIIKSGYGMRGKSKWLSEAIHQLLSINNYHEFVDIGNEMEGLSDIESFYITEELKAQLDQALVIVRTYYPAMEGVQSCIIRTSIIQRLIRAV